MKLPNAAPARMFHSHCDPLTSPLVLAPLTCFHLPNRQRAMVASLLPSRVHLSRPPAARGSRPPSRTLRVAAFALPKPPADPEGPGTGKRCGLGPPALIETCPGASWQPPRPDRRPLGTPPWIPPRQRFLPAQPPCYLASVSRPWNPRSSPVPLLITPVAADTGEASRPFLLAHSSDSATTGANNHPSASAAPAPCLPAGTTPTRCTASTKFASALSSSSSTTT